MFNEYSQSNIKMYKHLTLIFIYVLFLQYYKSIFLTKHNIKYYIKPKSFKTNAVFIIKIDYVNTVYTIKIPNEIYCKPSTNIYYYLFKLKF